MRPSSAKAKGRKLQQEIRDKILEQFPQLEADDVKVAIMGESGVDIHLSPAARKLIPLSIEAKCQEALNVWGALKQAQENCKTGTYPALVFRRNRTEPYIALRFEDFFKLLLTKAEGS
jgi:hypothetical protein